MKRGLIISGGCLDEAFAAAYLRDKKFDQVIAVDAGLKGALDLGLRVDAAVGDFDSADPGTLAAGHRQRGITWEVHRPEKDETDTELAVTTAVRCGCGELVILGALGGRMDHALGNIHLLYYVKKLGANAALVDRQNRITVLTEGRSFREGEIWGKYISFLPLTMEVKGITLTGFRYPLENRDISIGPCLCISNELAAPEAEISFREGVLICVESRDGDDQVQTGLA